MRDYLGSDVATAMELIRALAPPPPPPPPAGAALGAPVKRKGGGMLKGPGDGRSDSIPAALGAQPVKVSDGEYVVPADVVSALGRGSSDAGARKLTDMVLGVREGYRDHLGSLGKPAKGPGDKLLGGLFESQQDTEIVLPKYINDIGGANAQLLQGVWRNRQRPGDDVAGFTDDQKRAMDAGRNIATGDPYMTNDAFWQARQVAGGQQQNFDRGQLDLIDQQGRVRGAQDMLGGQTAKLDAAQGMVNDAAGRIGGQFDFLNKGQGELSGINATLGGQYQFLNKGQSELGKASDRIDGQYGNLDTAQAGLGAQRQQVGGAQSYLQDVLGPGGENQALIDATLGSFDYQRAKDMAQAQRQRAGRQAFGERRAIAEDEESVASNLARANLEAGLRDQAINRRMEAASGIGSLAQTGTGIENAAGNLTGQAGQLAGTQANIATGRGQLAGAAGNLAGQQTDVTQTRGALVNSAGNLSGTLGNLAGTSGNLVDSGTRVAGQVGQLADTSGSLTSRSGVLAGQNIDAARTGADLAVAQRGVGVSNVGLLQGIGDQQQTQDQRVLDAPYNRVAIGNQFRSGAPSATSTTSSPGLGQILLGAAATGAGAYFGAKDGGRIKDVRKKAMRRADGGMMEDETLGGAAGAWRRNINRVRAQKAAAEEEMPALGAKGSFRQPVRPDQVQRPHMFADGGEIQSYYDIARMGIPSPREALMALPKPEMPAPIPGMAANAEFNQRLDEFRARTDEPGVLGSVGDALGLNYLGPDQDGAGGLPGTFERRIMKDRTAPAAPAPERFPAEVAEKLPPQSKAPLAERVNQIIARGATPQAQPPRPAMAVPALGGGFMPEMKTRGAEPAAGSLGNFMPEMKTRGPEPAAAPEQGRSLGDRVEGAFMHPLTQFGLALLADDGRSGFAGAVGKAGLQAADAVSRQRAAKEKAASESRAELLELRQLGLSEEQARAAMADRVADNARQEARDAASQANADRNFAAQEAYRNQSLGIQNAGLDLRRQTEARLAKGGGGEARTNPRVATLYSKLDEAMLNDDAEMADRIRQQIALIESDGGDAALGGLPPGFDLDEPALKDGGMVKKRPGKARRC